MSDFEPSIRVATYARSITIDEFSALRRAITHAQETGTVTWVKNAAGEPVAAIVPVTIANAGLLEVGQ